MKTVNILNGQSNYDICLQVYGSLDMLIKLCKDNDVQDINEVTKKSYIYDPSLIIDKSITGFKYATNAGLFNSYLPYTLPFYL